jgi:hypothetical protein
MGDITGPSIYHVVVRAAAVLDYVPGPADA